MEPVENFYYFFISNKDGLLHNRYDLWVGLFEYQKLKFTHTNYIEGYIHFWMTGDLSLHMFLFMYQKNQDQTYHLDTQHKQMTLKSVTKYPQTNAIILSWFPFWDQTH